MSDDISEGQPTDDDQNLATSLQEPVKPPPSLRHRIVVWCHMHILVPLSNIYCRCTGEKNMGGIYWLPFNLVLKYGPRTHEDEARAMSFAHSIGLPAPKLLSYGAHVPKPAFPFLAQAEGFTKPWGSILMTRLPGEPLDEVLESLSDSEIENIKRELDAHLSVMRQQTTPWGLRICSMSGGALYGPRLPGGAITPCDNEVAFTHNFLLFEQHYRETRPDTADEVAQRAKSMLAISHSVVFTHADLMAHNILVRGGHISGIIDWGDAGWYPEYWEYTQMLRVSWMHLPWPKLVRALPGYCYQRELAAGEALWTLASDSFGW